MKRKHTAIKYKGHSIWFPYHLFGDGLVYRPLGNPKNKEFVGWKRVTSIKEAKALINKRIASKQNNK